MGKIKEKWDGCVLREVEENLSSMFFLYVSAEDAA